MLFKLTAVLSSIPMLQCLHTLDSQCYAPLELKICYPLESQQLAPFDVPT